MEKSEDHKFNSLPSDVALRIASFLQVSDLSSLGCCSRVWREFCRSDCLWEPIFKERWPLSYESALEDPNFKGWRAFYIEQHERKAGIAACVVNLVEQCSLSESIDINDFMKAVGFLISLRFGFKDVQMLFFKPKLNVLLNLVGLHFCLSFLQVPASDVLEALQSSKISGRQVCVSWGKIGRLLNGFRMPDVSHSRCISLEDLATAKDKKMLGVFDQRTIHEVYNVQISFANF
ncbi:hypothetical protein DITRI_Ditri15bG0116500 [Diplodiscus trichospermus]